MHDEDVKIKARMVEMLLKCYDYFPKQFRTQKLVNYFRDTLYQRNELSSRKILDHIDLFLLKVF